MKRGIPAVLLATERFSALAATTFRAKGVAAPPMVVLPKTEVTEFGTPAQVAQLARDGLGQVIQLWSGKEHP